MTAGISVLLVGLVLFLVFMFSSKNASDSAKTVSLVIGIVLGLILAYFIIRG